jgi:ParB-like chromosome segregation protein Spo0J
VEELRPHPSYERHQLAVSASQLSAIAEREESAFEEPLIVTQDGFIVDGYARWELARRQGRTTLPCIKYELNAQDALQRLIQWISGATTWSYNK